MIDVLPVIIGLLIGLLVMVMIMPFVSVLIDSYFEWSLDKIDSWKRKRYYRKHPEKGLKL